MATLGPSETPVRVAVGCTFLNAADILPTTLANLVAQGVSDIYLVDHANEQEIWSALRARLGSTVNLHVVRKETAPFYQGAMMTILLNLARRDGAHAFVPLDSDEFLDVEAGTTLQREIARWLEGSTDGLQIPVVNYLQSRDVETFDESNLADAVWRVLPSGRPQDRDAADGPRPHLERVARVKTIVRLKGLDDPLAVWIGEGSHEVYRVGPPHVAISNSVATRIVLRHLPLRSRAVLDRRGEHTRRRRLMGRGDNRGTPSGPRDAPGLDGEWHAHSVPPGGPDDAVSIRLRLVPDEALARLRHRLPAPPSSIDGANDSIVEISAAAVFTAATDVLGRHMFAATGESGRPASIRPASARREGEPDAPRERTRAVAAPEIARARQRARAAEERLAQLEHSASWRLTAPLRALRRRLGRR